ncbi:MAG: hypothetical protein FJ333_09930 [Sphingomonadales bacterium]|nr:hypothetical protein [Sphingomonadales bacterium]
MMKKIIVLAAFLVAVGVAQASCFGTGAYRTCNDAAGNSYSVQRFGNSTYMQGSNPYTGSTWNQSSQTFGNTTYIQGNTNGNSWNQTITTMPGMTIQSGTDSRGNSFSRTCNAFGCF